MCILAYFRNQWVCDRDLAAELNWDAKKVIPILKFLEEEKMIQRDTLREVRIFSVIMHIFCGFFILPHVLFYVALGQKAEKNVKENS